MKSTQRKLALSGFFSGGAFRVIAVILALLLAGMTNPGVAQLFDGPPPSLKRLPALAAAQGVPLEPPNLMDYVKDKQAAIQLGKALYWDLQLGSDGVTACASCHFHAGADGRSKNQLSPGLLDQFKSPTGDTRFGNSAVKGAKGYSQFGPNYQLKLADFPLHKREFSDIQRSNILQDTNDVISSQGVVLKQFTGINPGSAEDLGSLLSDPVFQVKKKNTRRVEPVNAPSVINAKFNFANFVNGRANHYFNGENPFGPADESAGIWVDNGGGVVEKQPLNLPFSSLASQAVGPPVSDLEMSWRGRTWAQIGKKMLSLTPLAKQVVASNDSVLGSLAKTAPDKGLNTTYADLIQAAFQDKYWNSSNIITFDAAAAPLKQATLEDPRTFKLNSGKATVKAAGTSVQALAANEYTQIEANFAFFSGVALQLYQATLVSDDSPFDQYMDGDNAALNTEARRGMEIFLNEGRCNLCHGGSLFTNAGVDVVMGINGPEGLIEPMAVATGDFALYDTGFYNIAVRPTTEDVGRGGTAPFINPITGQPFPLSHTKLARLKSAGLLPDWYVDFAEFLPAVAPVDAVAGAMKTPGLRNVELTGPYFHNGDSVTLMQTIDFYTRGGNFPKDNRQTLSPFIGEIPLLRGNEPDQNALVAFLLALTDERVRYEKAPFDHPQIFVPDGHNANLSDNLVEIPAVGAGGRTEPLRPFLAPAGKASYEFHITP
jgi:cytochrome c peroxidase